MSYKEWANTYLQGIESILNKLEGLPMDKIVDYFNYDNMQKNEEGFCPLYRTFTKCHVTEKLNCLLCACPYFKYSDSDPLEITDDGKKVMSLCTINSSKAGKFEHEGIVHCDCSNCLLPHSRKFIDKEIAWNEVEDTSSLLEMVRSYQLSDILGKYKLFV